jgi:hypothetical protein
MPTTTAALRSAHCEACFIGFISDRDRSARRPRELLRLRRAPRPGAPLMMAQQPSMGLESHSVQGGSSCAAVVQRGVFQRGVQRGVFQHGRPDAKDRRIQRERPWESPRCGTLQGAASYQTTTHLSKARGMRFDTARACRRPCLEQCAPPLRCAPRCEPGAPPLAQIKLSRAEGMRTVSIGYA